MEKVRGTGIARVIVVVIDGVRADAAALYGMTHLQRIAGLGASTFRAETVAPSVTAAAMGSLFTGVLPRSHGLESEQFRLPRPKVVLHPMPRVLKQASIPSYAFLAQIPRPYQELARHFGRLLGVTGVTFAGDTAREILDAARPTLRARDRGLFVFHWPDADRAGHASGWTSSGYARAVVQVDTALGELDAVTQASTCDGTMLVVVADHGGGGARPRNHDSTHVHDRRIPLVVAGGSIRPSLLPDGVSLLDVPATVLWALGVAVPPSYEGRPLCEAFGFHGALQVEESDALLATV